MGSPSVPTPAWVPSPQNATAADASYMTNLSGLGNVASGGYGAASNIANNPYAKGQQAGAGAAGSYLTGTAAPAYYGASSNLYNAVNSALPYSTAILQQGFDPQHALYNQQYKLNQQQTLANEAQQGVSNTPFGAGVTSQSGTNFNLGWQNQQLGREATALGAYGGFLGQAGQGYGQAGALGEAGAQAYYAGAGLPYTTYVGQQQNTLGGYGAASNLYNNATNAAGNYLNLVSQNYAQDQLPAYDAKYQANQAQWQGIGNLLGGAIGGAGGLGGLGSLAGLIAL